MKTICLTLVETPQIEAKAREHFAAVGLDNVDFYYGIHAKTAGLLTKNTYEVDHPDEHFNMGEHGVGIYVAFRSLWSAMLLLPDEHIMVVEHDIIFHDGWKARLDAAMRDVPKDFDMLLTGHCCAADKPRTHMAGEVWDVRYPMCNHAAVYNKKCLKRLLELCSKCWAPIDLQLIFDAFPHLKVYTLMPRLADQFNTVIPD